MINANFLIGDRGSLFPTSSTLKHSPFYFKNPALHPSLLLQGTLGSTHTPLFVTEISSPTSAGGSKGLVPVQRLTDVIKGQGGWWGTLSLPPPEITASCWVCLAHALGQHHFHPQRTLHVSVLVPWGQQGQGPAGQDPLSESSIVFPPDVPQSNWIESFSMRADTPGDRDSPTHGPPPSHPHLRRASHRKYATHQRRFLEWQRRPNILARE